MSTEHANTGEVPIIKLMPAPSTTTRIVSWLAFSVAISIVPLLIASTVEFIKGTRGFEVISIWPRHGALLLLSVTATGSAIGNLLSTPVEDAKLMKHLKKVIVAACLGIAAVSAAAYGMTLGSEASELQHSAVESLSWWLFGSATICGLAAVIFESN